MRRHSSPLGIALMAILAVAFTAVAQSSDTWVGTWKVNLAKSTYSPGPPPKNPGTTKLEPWEGGQKATTDGLDDQGKPTHTEAISRFDGKDYKVEGAATPTTRTYKRIDSRTYEFITKVNGKVTTTARSVTSADGKTRTLTTTGTNAQGQKVLNVVVYDRQ